MTKTIATCVRRKLVYAAPEAGAGATTLAKRLNEFLDVQAIAAYDLLLDEVAAEFGLSNETIRQYKNRPGDLLSLFNAGPATRRRLWKKYDPYAPRSAGFYVAAYQGELLDPPLRASRMLGRIRTPEIPNHIVIFDLPGDNANKVIFQNYAHDSRREFILLDLTRESKPRYHIQGARHIQNVEGNPTEAADAIRQLLLTPTEVGP
jgi:hypothetical protein